LLEESPRVIERDRLKEGLGRQPCPAGKQLLQAGRLHGDCRRDRLERRLLAPIFRQVFDHLPDNAVVVGAFGNRRRVADDSFG
jgi:hypothetical protein